VSLEHEYVYTCHVYECVNGYTHSFAGDICYECVYSLRVSLSVPCVIRA